ncbi:hypothetical protein DUNSADRAFT_6095 [Dunaliella salina]|nr:hypothetical protein DUNSADRAFT_6095 [Dunaliella salina]|eukprot:KAF5842627.1 hypothetical protein DUNSADRAFT_6095 [Dunaliella salina]
MAAVTGAMYAFLFVRTAKPGMQRLLSALPVLLLHCLLPLLFDYHQELASRASAAAMLTWLGNFKVFLLCMGRGPLKDTSLDKGQFAALMLWPVLHVEDQHGHPVRLQEPLRKLAALKRLTRRAPENAILALLGIATLVTPHLPTFLKIYSAAFGVAAYCDLCANAAAALVMYAHGLAVAPSWDRPWLQTSPSDFWSKRWNLPASHSLRALVFAPIMEGAAVEGQQPPLQANPFQTTLAHLEPSPVCSMAAQAQPGGESVQAGGILRSAEPKGTQDVSPAASTASSPLDYVLVGRGQEQAPRTEAKSGHQGDEEGCELSPGAKQAAPGPAIVDSGGGAESGGGLRHRQPPDTLLKGEAATKSIPKHTKKVSTARRLLALACTFFVSGLMHELLLLICTGWRAAAPFLGLQTLYFMLQVPVSLLEQQVTRFMKRGGIFPPRWLCIPVASLTLQIPGYWMFWGPIFGATCAARAGL